MPGSAQSLGWAGALLVPSRLLDPCEILMETQSPYLTPAPFARGSSKPQGVQTLPQGEAAPGRGCPPHPPQDFPIDPNILLAFSFDLLLHCFIIVVIVIIIL